MAPTVTVYTWKPQACCFPLTQHLHYQSLLHPMCSSRVILRADANSSRNPSLTHRDWAGYHYCGFSQYPVLGHTTATYHSPVQELGCFLNQHVHALGAVSNCSVWAHMSCLLRSLLHRNQSIKHRQLLRGVLAHKNH